MQGFDEGLGVGIHASIIIKNPPHLVRLSGKDNRGDMACGGGLNPSTAKEVDELPAELSQFA